MSYMAQQKESFWQQSVFVLADRINRSEQSGLGRELMLQELALRRQWLLELNQEALLKQGNFERQLGYRLKSGQTGVLEAATVVEVVDRSWVYTDALRMRVVGQVGVDIRHIALVELNTVGWAGNFLTELRSGARRGRIDLTKQGAQNIIFEIEMEGEQYSQSTENIRMASTMIEEPLRKLAAQPWIRKILGG